MSAPQTWGAFQMSPSTSMWLYVAITAETTNVANNTSTLSYKIWLQKDTTGNYNISNGNYYSLSIGGQTIAANVDYGAINTSASGIGTQVVLRTGTVTCGHNNDGTGSVTVNASFRNKLGASASSGNQTFVMATIPRASSINSVTNVTIGSAPTVKWTPKASSFGYKLKFELGGWSYTTGAITPNKTTEHTYNSYAIPVSVADKITASTSGTCTVTLYSYSTTACTTLIGTSSKTFTVTIPNTAEFAPTIDSFTVTPSQVFGDYELANYTTYSIVVNATARHSTTLKYDVNIVNSTGAIVFSSTNSSSTTGTFGIGGDYTVNIKITDGRGFTDTVQSSFTLTAYNKPTVSASIVRGTGSGDSFIVDESLGTTARITYEARYTPLDGNTLVVKIVKPDGTVDTPSSSPWYSTGYADDQDYEFAVKAYDSVTDESKAEETKVLLSKATFPIDILPNAKGIALGKVCEIEALEVAFDAIFYKKMIGIYPVGSIYMSVVDTNPSTYFGGEWERIQDRFLLCAGTSYSAGATGGESSHTLTISEMPNHGHGGGINVQGYEGWPKIKTDTFGVYINYESSGGNYFHPNVSLNATTTSGISVYNNGGGIAHNNMPPYLAVYVWKRVN